VVVTALRSVLNFITPSLQLHSLCLSVCLCLILSLSISPVLSGLRLAVDRRPLRYPVRADCGTLWRPEPDVKCDEPARWFTVDAASADVWQVGGDDRLVLEEIHALELCSCEK